MVMSGVPPPMVEALRRVRRRMCETRLWTCCAGRAGTRIRSEAPHRMLTIGRLAAHHAGARPLPSHHGSGSNSGPPCLTNFNRWKKNLPADWVVDQLPKKFSRFRGTRLAF